MTQKQTLANEYYKLRSKLTDFTFTEEDVIYLAKHRTSAWLVDNINDEQKKYDARLHEEMKKDYLASEAGKTAMKKYEALMDDLHDRYYEEHNTSSKILTDYMCSIYGDDALVSVHREVICVGLKDKDHENHFQFGHDFNIYYHNQYSWDAAGGMTVTTGKPEINFGAMGSFTPEDAPRYCKYLRMLADIANNPEMLNMFTSVIAVFNENIKALDKEDKMLRDWANDPVNTHEPWAA